MSTIAKVIKMYGFDELVERCKQSFGAKSATQLALMLGYSSQAWATRKKNQSFPYEALLRECEERDIDVNWLLTGSASLDKDYVRLPLLDIQAGAGNGVVSPDDLPILRFIDVLESWATERIGSDLSHIRLISARGDSMDSSEHNGIRNDDVVFVDVSVTEYESEGIYVFSRDGELQIKRLQRRGEQLLIISDNPRYSDEVLDKTQARNLILHGKVCACWPLIKIG